MIQRIAAWSLFLVVVAQATNLWPLPGSAAAARIAFWSSLKADWEATAFSKPETPRWTAEGKSESLSRINEALADTNSILYQARVEWGLWLFSVLVSLAAAVMALRASWHWRWLALVALALFLWLQQPWYMFGVFFPEGEFDLGHGIRQLSFIGKGLPGTLSTMLVLNLVVPVMLFAVAAYAVVEIARGRKRSAL